jgi:glycosyltransferase involved in cell wall biosynthesis
LVEELNTNAFLLFNFRDLVASNALLEAVSYVLPIISNKHYALDDYFESGCIYTLPPTSETCPEKLSEKIIALAKNKEKQKKLSIQLKNGALSLDWNQIGRKTNALYVSLIKTL